MCIYYYINVYISLLIIDRELVENWQIDIFVFSLILSRLSTDRSVQLKDLWPGFEYNVRVLVMTDSGLVDGSTNQRVQGADFITNCSGIYVKNSSHFSNLQ